MAQEKVPAQQLKIDLEDRIPGAEYANLMNIAYGKEEFVLMFANAVAGKGRVVSKVMTSPGHMKRIAKLLDLKMKEYEQQFGPVDEAESPKNEIGFSDRG